MQREIYSVAFNKFINGGVMKMVVYTIGAMSATNGKIPEKIEQIKDKVITTFTDGSRHIIFYNNDVELLDREIKPKPKEDKDASRKD